MTTHSKLATGRVAIYARYSSDLQSESSIHDQVRRAHEAISRAGGDPGKAIVFPDFAISGASMQRPGLESLLNAAMDKSIDVIVTEDVSRLSRDMGDSANIVKRLAFAGVTLISLSDGIDTSSKNAKPLLAVKSMLAEMFLDDLRDKTLRGLEGRMLAGFATGGVPYGFRTLTLNDGGRIVHPIEIDEEKAAIVRRIFETYRNDGALHRIARQLNREGVPSPRAGSKHKRFGWGAPTIRAMLYNEKYVGTWRFKQRKWVKEPGTNKRVPQARPADEVMCIERPELRIIDPELWAEVQARLVAVNRKYTKKGPDGEPAKAPRVAGPWRTHYLLSGVLVCAECGFPLTIYGGESRRYYRCNTNYSKGTCSNDLKVKEAELRGNTLATIRAALQSKEAIEYVRRQVAERVGDYSRHLEAELRERRERLKRDEDRLKGLVQFIADGDRSEYVVTTLRDLEAHAKVERAAIDRLQRETREPLRLPSLPEITAAVFEMDRLLSGDVQEARLRLRRWIKGGEIRVSRHRKGYEVAGSIYPLALAAENGNSQQNRGVVLGESNVSSGGRI